MSLRKPRNHHQKAIAGSLRSPPNTLEASTAVFNCFRFLKIVYLVGANRCVCSVSGPQPRLTLTSMPCLAPSISRVRFPAPQNLRKMRFPLPRNSLRQKGELGVSDAYFYVPSRSYSRKGGKKDVVCWQSWAQLDTHFLWLASGPQSPIRTVSPQPPDGRRPPASEAGIRRGSSPGLLGMGGGQWEWKLEMEFRRCRAGRGPPGAQRKKARGQAWQGKHRAPEVGCGASRRKRALGIPQHEGLMPRKCTQVPQTREGGVGKQRPVAPGPPVARRPLTCQQEGASGRGAHPACPPTLSRPSTRVSQLPPPGQLHSWPG